MSEIQEKIQKLLCDLLEDCGKTILLNSKEERLEDRVKAYQDIIEHTQKINDIINYIISETENYNK